MATTSTSTGPATTRNVALVGHSGSGKTTLAEAFLHRAGAVPRPGSVAEGTTVCDHEPEEVARGISVSLGVAHLDWRAPDGTTYQVTLLDTPGSPDFAGSVDAALAVADLAVVVVSAVDGVQSGTEEVWRRCDEAGIPRLVVVSQEDRARASFRAVLAALRAAFDAPFAPLELPLGEEQTLHGVADVLTERAREYGGGAQGVWQGHDEEVPADVRDEEHALHDEVVEEIVTHDDDQLEAYLGGDEPGPADLERTLAHEVLTGEAVPVLLASAVTGVGVDRVLDLVCELGPSPADRPAVVALPDAAGSGEAVTSEVVADPAGDALVHVFRTVVDPFVGQVSVFKVLSGTVATGDRLVSTATGADDRVHGLFRLRGREHLAVDRVVAGDVAAVAKLSAASTGTLLAGRRMPVAARDLPPRPPVYALALRPVSQSDDDKLSAALTRLRAEDATLHVDLTGSQAVLGGLGDTHLAVAVERLERSFGVRVTTEPVQVAYRETITRAVEVEGRVKKQSGGHGQFAVVRLRVSPLPRGEGFAFVSSVVGGSVPRQYLPAVERGAREAMESGGPHGYPVVDLRVEVLDGKAHSVDSSDMAFRTAGGVGVREALATAGTVVLEPVSAVTVTVPPDAQGDVMGDLSARRGHITSTDSLPDGRVRIDALVPEAELTRYVLDLRSITGGRGSFTAAPDRYEVLPGGVGASR
ncbi:elongation factor G [Cellulosimicrobium funkei]|uniref:Elongation factor G n=1 Tax=Cellulosimicrobium funkei TaxID=264251 RepID=A0A4Y8R4J0_9MICO|nr:elongation factor G [Cellulosimicrobium funkei]TFF12672.1 elongation factor G [Cellulosimicrobium funkei]TGA77208.1 elongation factor G [Cellulosimicrobium terreum]